MNTYEATYFTHLNSSGSGKHYHFQKKVMEQTLWHEDSTSWFWFKKPSLASPQITCTYLSIHSFIYIYNMYVYVRMQYTTT